MSKSVHKTGGTTMDNTSQDGCAMQHGGTVCRQCAQAVEMLTMHSGQN